MQLLVFAQSTLYFSHDGQPTLKKELPYDESTQAALVICGDAGSHTVDGLYKTAATLTHQSTTTLPDYNQINHASYTIYDTTTKSGTPLLLVRHSQALLANPNQLLIDIQQHLNKKGINITETSLYTNNFRQHIQTKDLTNVTSHFVTCKNPFSFNMKLPAKPIEKAKTTNSAALIGQFSQTFNAKSCTEQAREAATHLTKPTAIAVS